MSTTTNALQTLIYLSSNKEWQGKEIWYHILLDSAMYEVVKLHQIHNKIIIFFTTTQLNNLLYARNYLNCQAFEAMISL